MSSAALVADIAPNLATISRTRLPVAIRSIKVADDGSLTFAAQASASHARFVLDDIQYEVSIKPDADGTAFEITGRIGYVPYTAESQEQRHQVLTILQATRSLPGTAFEVDQGNCIVLRRKGHATGPLLPSDLMYELALFLQEARPYLRLLADYLK